MKLSSPYGFSSTGLCSLCLCVSAHYYVMFNTPKTWLEAQSFCREKCQEYCRTNHTDLTNIRSEAELQFISALAGSGSVWVGGFTDRWEWSDQSTSSFRYWRSNEKFWGSDGGECGVLTKNGRWGRLSCSEKRPFLCTCKDPGAASFKSLCF
uniref:C-type lectin domain-containing protein n=1 Tax=Stegastes partitus TaxID=144197 RepID=A0A3B5A802_9TELE